jgi:hypothetical protein
MPLTQTRSLPNEARQDYRQTPVSPSDEDHLQQLARQARSGVCSVRSRRCPALDRLLVALKDSGRLRGRGQYPVDVYEDAVNRTLCWVALHIDRYDERQGRFLAWVNYRLNVLLKEAYAETLEPLVRAEYGQIIRRKYQLTAIATQVDRIGLDFWLRLGLKGIDLDPLMMVWLSVLCQLSRLRSVDRTVADGVFLKLARMSLSPLRQVDGEAIAYENLAQPEDKPYLSELVREYLESDPELLSRLHVRDCRSATLKAILIARLEDRSWQEIADSFSLTVAAVKNFFSRQMKTVAPLIGQEILS